MNESLLLTSIAILNLIFVVALFKKFRDKESSQSDKDIEALQEKIANKLGYKLVDHKLELYGSKIKK